MAELTTTEDATSGCCSPAAQQACCDPSEKDACCGTSAAGGACGCSAGAKAAPAADIRETVREKYAAAARLAAEQPKASCGCGPAGDSVFGSALYDIKQSLLSHHMRKLVEAGLVSVERRHKWAYYSTRPDALKELNAWLS